MVAAVLKACVGGLGLCVVTGALAQDAAAPPTVANPGIEQQLQARDALIRELQQRLLALEQRLGMAPAAAAASTAASAAPGRPGAAPVSAEQAALAAPAAPPQEAGTDDEAARALERALVREGGFVLPPGALEVEPRLQHTYNGARGLGIVQPDGTALVTPRSENRHQTDTSVALRYGLPGAAQVELRLPYVFKREATTAAGLGLSQKERTHGLGDVDVQLSKLLLTEQGARPALMGSFSWQPATGRYDAGQLSPGGGFPSVQLGLTAVKRQDPLVFFGGLNHTWYRPRGAEAGRLQPGNGVGMRLGALLAASPETSLRASLDLSRNGQSRLNGAALPGSDTLSGVVELGLSSLVSRRVAVDLSVGLGITPDAPDFRLGIAFPIRFY